MAEPAQLTEPAPAISPAQSYVVEARRLAKSYRPTVAVADVDLLVERGSVFGALGPSWRCLLCCWRFCAPRSRRSAGLAVGTALGVYFMEGIFTGLVSNATGWVSHIPDALLNINADSIMTLNGTVPGEGAGPLLSGSDGEPIWRASLVLAVGGSVRSAGVRRVPSP